MKRGVIDIKPHLVEKLKQEHCLWRYDSDSIQDIPDDVLVELVMLYHLPSLACDWARAE